MTVPGWITLITIAAAGLLLITGWLRPDLIALMVILALGLTGVLAPEQALSGFSQSAVITILSIFILTGALEQTGVARWIGQTIQRKTGNSERNLTAALTLGAAFLSLFMNTVASTAVLLPTTMGIARQTKIRPSRLLMPLAFGSLLGGTATLLTTANIIVSSTLDQAGYRPFGLFDFLPIGGPLAIVGTILILMLAPRLLPSVDIGGSIARMRLLQSELAQVYHLKESTSEVVVLEGSAMVGQTLGGPDWGRAVGLTVLGISHENSIQLAPDRDTPIYEGDVVLLDGTLDNEELQSSGLERKPSSKLSQILGSSEYPLVEAVLAPRSQLEGRTLRQIQFRDRYGIQAVAIWREGKIMQKGLADIPLRFGDAMLLQGPRAKVDLLRFNPDFLLLEEEADRRPTARAPLAVTILLASLGLAATGVLPIALATLAGAVMVIATGCIKMDHAYQAIEWKAIFFIAGMLPLSIALQSTGTAAVLGDVLIDLTYQLGSLATAGVLIGAAITLSIFLGGQTAAIILAPIGIAAARLAGADPRALAMAVAVGSSLAFLSPLGHPSNLLVLAPGGYTFRDYFRLGAPLTLAAILITLAGLHWYWGI